MGKLEEFLKEHELTEEEKERVVACVELIEMAAKEMIKACSEAKEDGLEYRPHLPGDFEDFLEFAWTFVRFEFLLKTALGVRMDASDPFYLCSPSVRSTLRALKRLPDKVKETFERLGIEEGQDE